MFLYLFFSAVLTDTAYSVYPLGLVFWMCLSRRLQYLEIIYMQEWIVMSCSWFDRWEARSVSQSQAWQRTVITHQTAVKRHSLHLIWIHLDFVSRGHILQEFQGHPGHFAFFMFKKGTSELVQDRLGILEMLFPGLWRKSWYCPSRWNRWLLWTLQVLSPFARIQLGRSSVQTAWLWTGT